LHGASTCERRRSGHIRDGPYYGAGGVLKSMRWISIVPPSGQPASALVSGHRAASEQKTAISRPVCWSATTERTCPTARSIEKCRKEVSPDEPCDARCPYPDGRRSDSTSEAPGTMLRSLPASTRGWTREGPEG